MLITYGYCILRPNFEPRRLQTMSAIVIATFLSLVGMVYVHRYVCSVAVCHQLLYGGLPFARERLFIAGVCVATSVLPPVHY